MKNFPVFYYFLLGLLFIPIATIAEEQEKIYLKCNGSAKTGSTDEKNISSKGLNSFTKLNTMSLLVTINGKLVTVENSHEFKKIETVYPDKSTGYTFEHGNLEIKDSYYDGVYSRETYGNFKDSIDHPYERSLYNYKYTRFILDRFEGTFTWRLTYYGNS